MLDGAERWVSAHFVNRAGPCLPQDDNGRAVPLEDLRAREGRLSNLVFLIGDDADSAVPLADCQVTPRENLRVRIAPAGQRTGLVMTGHSLRPLARTENWFMIEHDGAERWVSAHFVNMRGACQPEATGLTDAAPAESAETQSASPDKMGDLASSLAEDAVSARPVADCQLKTLQSAQGHVKPAGEKTTLIAESQTLRAMARTRDWFLVLIDGAGHWVSAKSVYANGGCQ